MTNVEIRDPNGNLVCSVESIKTVVATDKKSLEI